jgi:hypothetical protein
VKAFLLPGVFKKGVSAMRGAEQKSVPCPPTEAEVGAALLRLLEILAERTLVEYRRRKEDEVAQRD